RACSDNYMDVGTVNWHDPERPMKFHNTGAMHHVKGFAPWGARQFSMYNVDADAGVWGHWIDPEAYLWRYYLEGHARAGELYRTWGTALSSGKLPYGPGREASNTIGMTLGYY